MFGVEKGQNIDRIPRSSGDKSKRGSTAKYINRESRKYPTELGGGSQVQG